MCPEYTKKSYNSIIRQYMSQKTCKRFEDTLCHTRNKWPLRTLKGNTHYKSTGDYKGKSQWDTIAHPLQWIIS